MARKYDVPAWKQLQLVRLALRHSETTKADVAVLAEIVQRYHGAYGNAWISDDMLIEETGVSRPSINRARRKLVDNDFITVTAQGKKGRATVYLPHFHIVPEKGIKSDTEIKGIMDDTEYAPLGITDDTGTPLLGIKDDTPSYIQSPAYKAGRQDIDNDTAPASPPLSSGLEADDAGRAIDGFDELYKAYGYRRNRAEAKAVYLKINPDPDLHAEMVVAATAWRERWAAQNKPDAPRYTLAKWLERECYLEDPPAGFAKQKPEAKTPEKSKRKKMNTGSKDAPRRFIIQSADVQQDGNKKYLIMVLKDGDDWTEDFSMLIDAASGWQKEEGQKDLEQLCVACGVPNAQDTSELVGRTFLMNANDEFCRAPNEATQNG